MDRVTEDDLLALIEGELPEERVPVVETALRGDRELLARVLRMRDDRERLRETGAADRAPGGLVEEAMARAEQRALMQVDAGGAVRSRSLARGSRVRRVQMVVAACVLLGAVGVWVGLMMTVSSGGDAGERPTRNVRLAEANPRDGRADPVSEPDASATGPQAPAVTAPALSAALAEPAATVEADPLLAEWMRNIEAAEPAGPASLDYEAAAALALEGRLCLQIQGSATDGPLLADGTSEGARLAEFVVRRHAQTGGEGWRIELAYRVDEAETDLAAALRSAVEALEGRTGRRVILAAAEGTDAQAGPAPALDAASVLWWGEPSSGWVRRMVVRPAVAFAGE